MRQSLDLMQGTLLQPETERMMHGVTLLTRIKRKGCGVVGACEGDESGGQE